MHFRREPMFVWYEMLANMHDFLISPLWTKKKKMCIQFLQNNCTCEVYKFQIHVKYFRLYKSVLIMNRAYKPPAATWLLACMVRQHALPHPNDWLVSIKDGDYCNVKAWSDVFNFSMTIFRSWRTSWFDILDKCMLEYAYT